MKTRLLWVVLTFAGLTANALAGPRDPQWQEVNQAVKQGLPKTAIERLEPIITAALADHSYPEAIKAIGRKITLQAQIEGGRAEENIARFKAELENAPAAMKPAMETILAHWYWNYFQQNRWRFLQRSHTAASPGPDLQTWDLARILGEIDQHFSAALRDDAMLKATPVSDYGELLERGTAPDNYRPTLFDFVANEALQFYQAGEQGAPGAEDEFEVPSASPIFAEPIEFTIWQPNAADQTSPKLKAIRLYQSLLAFHQHDSDRSAYFDVDLGRLMYAHNIATGEAKEERYKAALRRFIEAASGHEISARGIAALATQLMTEGELTQAHALAERGIEAFPSSAGGTLCFNLARQIEARSAQLDTEYVWNAPWPTLNVTYRNVTKVYFRAVADDFSPDTAQRGGRNLDPNKLDELFAEKPALAWECDLPATTDFKSRMERLPAPTTLRPGFYHIIASHDAAFSRADNQLSVASICVSDLALVMQMRQNGSPHAGLVLNAKSGEPVAGATVNVWRRPTSDWSRVNAPTLTHTDQNGRFEFSSKDEAIVVLAEYGGQAVATQHGLFSNAPAIRQHGETQTVFFTDRAIYRPGQTINYKAVAVRFDQDAGKYSAHAGLKLTVTFNDANGQEIARATHTTNDYGSISGVFTAPRDRLMGQMSLQVTNGQGATSFNVEEYKRPKFQVELQAPTEAAKLNEVVNVSGKAVAYTGAAIGGAKVNWRVERAVRLPVWCWWRQPPASKAVAHGTAMTDADGMFRIQFVADPDRTVPAKNEPTFAYAIHADVIDLAGETRSADRTVNAGYASLRASLSAADWQTEDKPVELNVSTKSLNGDAQSASGTVAINKLQQPSTVMRAPLERGRLWWNNDGDEPKADPSNPDSWTLGDKVSEQTFKTDSTGKVKIAQPLKAGIYRASVEAVDRFGQKVTARQTIEVVAPNDPHYAVKRPNVFVTPQESVEPGETFTALWGTGYAQGRAFVQLECNGRELKSYWTSSNRTQELITQPVTEAMRGGFTVRVTYLRENRAYLNQHVINVPWSNKQLSIRWESFRSKLEPGQKETWTAIVTGPNAKLESAEMVAALYDASLDQYRTQTWPQGFSVFRNEWSGTFSEFQNGRENFQVRHDWDAPLSNRAEWSYRAFPSDLIRLPGDEDTIVLSPFMIGAVGGADGSALGYHATSTLAGTRLRTDLKDIAGSVSVMTKQSLETTYNYYSAPMPLGKSEPDLGKIAARKNLNETAFFFPHLITDSAGVVKIKFTMPEALTQWKFLGFAHDRQLRAGFLTDKVVTAKDLMVEPNPPRFVREGDTIEFAVKVTNQSDHAQTGTVRLTFADAASQESKDAALANRNVDQHFELPAKTSRSFSWRVAVPDGMGFLTYKAVAASAQVSDGEEGFLPVLSRRVLVTESLPLHIRGKTTRQFDFKKLLESGSSDTLRHQALTVQMVSQPAWYAVMALPYLMEYPYECSEQVFNRYYANALARNVADSDPKIRRVFELWKNTPALTSPLEQNQDLKSVILEETPWVKQAKSQTQARRNVGLLFDENRLDDESARALHTLAERQLSGGLWSWFPGGPQSEYISLYITTGFGRLRHLGVKTDPQPAIKSLAGLDAWMGDNYRRILRTKKPEDYIPTNTDALYLYGRSFFLEDQPIAPAQREAIDFFLRQSRNFWLEVNCRQSQAHLAIALQRFGDKQTPAAIMKSLKERSLSNEELGMYWRDLEPSWWWYGAPIETQALMIEAFAEVANDAQAVEDCKVWLLKQKQTQDWRTTKATADAVYALLLRGINLLASDAVVEVSLGGETIKPDKVEAGTGFYEQTFSRDAIRPAMGHISVKKVDDGVSWGGVHWQYLEDMARVTPHEGTPLKLKKTLYLKTASAKGQVLTPVSGPLAVGDELVVRLELRTDRDMEFVHLKDQRGSGVEPVNVLSGHRYQDGLSYYETTRDTASHFFIDYLRTGVYVFEYSTRVQLKGRYQTGLAEIQCMYAPEFNSHSESFMLEVK